MIIDTAFALIGNLATIISLCIPFLMKTYIAFSMSIKKKTCYCIFVINTPYLINAPSTFFNQIVDKTTKNHSKWVQQVRFLVTIYKYIHTLLVHYAHAAANLNSGYSKYAKVARVHCFCTIALWTSRAVLTRAWVSRRIYLFSKRVII